jgi:hypothetical protein
MLWIYIYIYVCVCVCVYVHAHSPMCVWFSDTKMFVKYNFHNFSPYCMPWSFWHPFYCTQGWECRWCSDLLRAGQSDLNTSVGQEIFCFSNLSWPALGPTQPCVQGELLNFLGVQQSGHGGDHPSPSSIDIKKH